MGAFHDRHSKLVYWRAKQIFTHVAFLSVNDSESHKLKSYLADNKLMKNG